MYNFTRIDSDHDVMTSSWLHNLISVCGGNLKAEQTIGYIYSHARYSDGKYEKKMR